MCEAPDWTLELWAEFLALQQTSWVIHNLSEHQFPTCQMRKKTAINYVSNYVYDCLGVLLMNQQPSCAANTDQDDSPCPKEGTI